jgi:hypothetical protein
MGMSEFVTNEMQDHQYFSTCLWELIAFLFFEGQK